MSYLLIWDIDGTLIQSGGLGRRGMDRAFLELYGISNGFDGIEMAGMLDAVLLKKAYELHGIKQQDSKKYFEAYCKFLKIEIDKLNTPIYAPGIPELLELLHQKDNFYNVLATGNVEEAARLKLDVHNLYRFFPCGGFGELDVERWQIIQEAVHASQDLFNIHFEKNNIFVIGDTPRDIISGKKLGVRTVGIATGNYTVDQLAECGADYFFKDLSDRDPFLSIFLKY